MTQGDQVGLIRSLVGRLRYPQLFLVLAVLLVADIVVPDPLPYVDEAVLALLTAIFGSWKRRRDA